MRLALQFARFGSMLALLGVLALGVSSAQAARRNILLLIADDLGVDGSSFYPLGSRRETTPPAPPMPNLRRLADAGILFANAWASTFCVPSRGTIYTGRYAFRTGVGSNLEMPQYQTLTAAEFIMPEAFLPAGGYELAHIGKWHVSKGDNDPNDFGWPYFSGPEPFRSGVPSYFKWTKRTNGVNTPTTKYATTDSVDEAIAAIARAQARSVPYFIEVAFNAPHSPFHKPPNELHSYDALPPYGNGVNPRPYYEAMIEALDTEIGRLLQHVSLADTTVIFLGDNGSRDTVVVPPYQSTRSKGTMYQNGVRIPMLIAGAGVVQPKRMITALVSAVDIFPTVLDLAGIDLASVVPPGTKIDGLSMVPLMENRTGGARHQYIYTERFTSSYDQRYQRAIRNFEFKLIKRAGGSREFYNLRKDPLEKTNLLTRALSSTEQSKLNRLEAQLAALLASR